MKKSLYPHSSDIQLSTIEWIFAIGWLGLGISIFVFADLVIHFS